MRIGEPRKTAQGVEPSPLFLGICDECGKDKPIVIVCMIGCRLCAECQSEQQRISHQELTDYVLRPIWP